jgi:peptide/nickel transport system substrate-binding protein
MLNRRSLLASSAASLPLFAAWPAMAQAKKDSVTLAMTLEPPGLDPTAGAASSIAEVVLYNVFETLTKINSDGSVSPLLAESWEVSSDLKTYTFRLRKDVKFQNGEPFNAAAVKFSFDRAAADKSTNKDKRTFANLSTKVADEHTVVLTNQEIDPDFLFMMGQATSIIVEPKSAATNASKPVGTGPYQLAAWAKGASVTLTAWPGYRSAQSIRIKRAVFRFIPDPQHRLPPCWPAMSMPSRASRRAACPVQSQCPLSGGGEQLARQDHSGHQQCAKAAQRYPRAPCHCRRHRSQGRDCRCRRRLWRAHRQLLCAHGLWLCGHHRHQPFDLEKAKALMAEAGVKTPLTLTMTLPPAPYARQGGELIAAQLAKIGIQLKLQNVEWAQWLSGTYTNKNYDLTIISHVEPFDLGNFAKPDYYWGYQSQEFNELFDKIKHTPRPPTAHACLAMPSACWRMIRCTAFSTPRSG